MDDFPDIGSINHPRSAGFGVTSLGWPKYRMVRHVEGSVTNITLNIELRWPPELYPSAAAELKNTMLKKLLSAAPELNRSTAEGTAKLDISFYPP
jgi:hypothetical protein